MKKKKRKTKQLKCTDTRVCLIVTSVVLAVVVRVVGIVVIVPVALICTRSFVFVCVWRIGIATSVGSSHSWWIGRHVFQLDTRLSSHTTFTFLLAITRCTYQSNSIGQSQHFKCQCGKYHKIQRRKVGVHKLVKDRSTRHCRESFAGITGIANRWLIRSRCKSATVELAWKKKGKRSVSSLQKWFYSIVFYCASVPWNT